MKINRELVTPFVLFIFLLVALSGISMFFHLFDGYTEVMHEFLGLAFSLFAILHIAVNWKSIVHYSQKRRLILPSGVVLITGITLIFAGRMKEDVQSDAALRLASAPLYNAAPVLNTTYAAIKNRLNSAHIVVNGRHNPSCRFVNKTMAIRKK